MHAIGIFHDYLYIILHVAWPVGTNIVQMLKTSTSRNCISFAVFSNLPEDKVVCLQYSKKHHKNFWKNLLLGFEWLGALVNPTITFRTMA